MRQKPSKQKKGKTQNAMNTSVFRYIFCLLIFPLVNFLFIIIALFASFVHNSSFLVVDIAALILFYYFSAAYVLVPFSLFFRLEIERIRNSFPLNFFCSFHLIYFLDFPLSYGWKQTPNRFTSERRKTLRNSLEADTAKTEKRQALTFVSGQFSWFGFSRAH